METLLKELEERLPELEWRLNKLKKPFSTRLLPRSLFPWTFGSNVNLIIDTLKNEIKTLAKQPTLPSRFYLAQRLYQKITILVSCCDQLEEEKIKANFIERMCTHQQFVKEMQNRIDTLTLQKKALCNRLEHALVQSSEPQISLSLKKELGQIEQQLTKISEVMSGNH